MHFLIFFGIISIVKEDIIKMENNNGRGIFYGVIGVATLVVAIIGATFAYFSASITSNGIGAINSTVLTLQIMNETPLKRWATPEEIAEWAFFLTMTNSFCTGQNILVDGGESINYNFVWKND